VSGTTPTATTTEGGDVLRTCVRDSAWTPLTRLAGGDLLATRTAASDLPHVDLDEAAALLGSGETRRGGGAVPGAGVLGAVVITLRRRSAVRRVCLAQLERGDEESRASFAAALCRLRLERAAQRLPSSIQHPSVPSKGEDALAEWK
jgi:hypothetical protein